MARAIGWKANCTCVNSVALFGEEVYSDRYCHPRLLDDWRQLSARSRWVLNIVYSEHYLCWALSVLSIICVEHYLCWALSALSIICVEHYLCWALSVLSMWENQSEDRLLLSRQVESKFAHLGSERELRRSSYRNICTNSAKWNTMAGSTVYALMESTNPKRKSKAYWYHSHSPYILSD
jgi:hypothetical protein